MDCKTVQEELARQSGGPALANVVTSHIEGCPACRRVLRIDEALKRHFVWEPPEGFADATVLQVRPLLDQISEQPRVLSWNLLHWVALSFIFLSALYFGGLLFLVTYARLLTVIAANVVLATWAFSSILGCISFWFTRRALR
jgi:hypothetical protein